MKIRTTKALSIRQPWAWLILFAGKNIENRDWEPSYTGPLLIHAAATMTRADYQAAQLFLAADQFKHIVLPPPDQLLRGGIVGQVDMLGFVTDSTSPWFCGTYGFVFCNPEPLPFVFCRGMLGFFNIQRAAAEQLACDHEFGDSKRCVKCDWWDLLEGRAKA